MAFGLVGGAPLRRLLLLLLLVTSCGKVVGDIPADAGDGGAPPIDARAPTADAPLNPVDTVVELRAAMPREGDMVMLRNMVVVGRTIQRGVGVVYVQDQGGGMGTGIRLVCVFDGECTVTRSQIEGLSIDQRFDVAGVFDLTQAPAEPQLIRFTLTPRGNMAAVPTTVPAAMVAHDQAGSSAIGGWLLTYVKVDGPLTVTDIAPPALGESCDLPDAGAATGTRGVFVRQGASGPVLAVQTVDLDYCISQCGKSCDEDIMVGDVVTSLTGVLIVGERSSGTPELLIRPARDTR